MAAECQGLMTDYFSNQSMQIDFSTKLLKGDLALNILRSCYFIFHAFCFVFVCFVWLFLLSYIARNLTIKHV